MIDVAIKNRGITPAQNLKTKSRLTIFDSTPTPEQVRNDGGEFQIGL